MCREEGTTCREHLVLELILSALVCGGTPAQDVSLGCPLHHLHPNGLPFWPHLLKSLGLMDPEQLCTRPSVAQSGGPLAGTEDEGKRIPATLWKEE